MLSAVPGALVLGLSGLSAWLARRPTPQGVMLLVLILGPIMVGLVVWRLSRREDPRPPPEAYASEELGFFSRRPPGGRIEQALALAFLPVMAVWLVWNLAIAATRGAIDAGGREGMITLAQHPISFWAHVVAYGAGALFLAGLAGFLPFARQTRNRRIDAYLQKRADEGARASALPPRLR